MRTRRLSNRDLGKGLLRWHLEREGVRSVSPDEIPEGKATFVMWALPEFVRETAREIQGKVK